MDQPSKDGLPLIYSSASVRFFRTTSNFRFFVSIPVKADGRLFILHDVHTLPQLHREFNQSIEVVADTEVLAVSEDQMHYILLPTTFLARCQPGDVLLCPPEFPVRGIDFPSCSIAAFRGINTTTAELCSKKLVQASYSVFLPTGVDGEWLYSVSEPTKLSLRCQPVHSNPGKTINEWITIVGHGYLQLEAGCSAFHPKHTLLSRAIFSNTQKVNFGSRASLFRENFSIPMTPVEHELVKEPKVDKWSPILRTLQALDTQQTPGIPIHLMEDDQHILNPFSLNSQQSKSVFWSILSTILLALILFPLVKIVALGCYKTYMMMESRRRTRNRRDESALPLNNMPLNNAVAQGNPAPTQEPTAPREDTAGQELYPNNSLVVPTYYYAPAQGE